MIKELIFHYGRDYHNLILLPVILHNCYRKQKRAGSLLLVFTRSEGRLTTELDCLLQAITDSKSFTVSEHVHIWGFRLRISVADWGFSSTIEPSLRLSPYDWSHFSYHYWYPFGVRITIIVSDCVVACNHYVLLAFQHWEIAAPNYGLLYDIMSWRDSNIPALE